MAESGVKDIPMRLTGALAYHCAEQARALGITPAEYARSCVRLQLKAKGIDWNRLPEGVDPGDPELPGQQRLEHVADADSYRNPPLPGQGRITDVPTGEGSKDFAGLSAGAHHPDHDEDPFE